MPRFISVLVCGTVLGVGFRCGVGCIGSGVSSSSSFMSKSGSSSSAVGWGAFFRRLRLADSSMLLRGCWMDVVVNGVTRSRVGGTKAFD